MSFFCYENITNTNILDLINLLAWWLLESEILTDLSKTPRRGEGMCGYTHIKVYGYLAPVRVGFALQFS